MKGGERRLFLTWFCFVGLVDHNKTNQETNNDKRLK